MNWLAGLLPTVWCLATDPSRCPVGVHQQRRGLRLVADGHVGKPVTTPGGWHRWPVVVVEEMTAFHQSQGIKIRWSRATFLGRGNEEGSTGLYESWWANEHQPVKLDANVAGKFERFPWQLDNYCIVWVGNMPWPLVKGEITWDIMRFLILNLFFFAYDVDTCCEYHCRRFKEPFEESFGMRYPYLRYPHVKYTIYQPYLRQIVEVTKIGISVCLGKGFFRSINGWKPQIWVAKD